MTATDTIPETDDSEPRKKGKIVKLLIMLLIGIGLAGAGLGAGYYMFATKTTPADEIEKIIERRSETGEGMEGEDDPAGEGKPRKVVKSESSDNFKTTYYEFADVLTTNLKGSRRFLQVGLGLSTQYDETIINNVDMHQLALRSDVLGVISGFSEEDIASKDGRDLLAGQIRDVMNARLEQLEGFGGIQAVHFSSFILQ